MSQTTFNLLRRLLRVAATSMVVVMAVALGGALYQWRATGVDLGATPPPGRMVNVGGHRLHAWCRGSGPPAVILESGLGDNAFVWSNVLVRLGREVPVCAYDRAGMGYSDAGPRPRTSAQIVAELSALLDGLAVRDPIVLVGASIGGYHVRLFASRYPNRTAGLVLLDATSAMGRTGSGPTIPMYMHLLPWAGTLGVMRAFNWHLGAPPDLAAPEIRAFEMATVFRSARFDAIYRELMAIGDSGEQVRAQSKEVSSFPLVVVTSEQSNDSSDWRASQQMQARLSTRGCQVIADDAGHIIARDRPDLVVDAVLATLAASHQPATRPCEMMAKP